MKQLLTEKQFNEAWKLVVIFQGLRPKHLSGVIDVRNKALIWLMLFKAMVGGPGLSGILL